MGFRKLRGTESTPSSLRVRASSTRSFGPSPMPKMPPEHTVKPISLAPRMEATSSS